MHVSVLRVSAMGLQNFYIFNYQNITDKQSSNTLYGTKQVCNGLVTESITIVAISTNSQIAIRYFSESYSILVLYLQYYCKLHSRHVTSKTQNIDTWENNIGKYIDGYRYRQPEWKTRCNKYLLMLHYGVYWMFHETSSAFCRISKIEYNVIFRIRLRFHFIFNSV